MDSTMRGRLAMLMTATTVAVGIAGGFAAQAQAAAGSPAASYCGQGSEKACASGGAHHKSQGGKRPCCGGDTVIANNGPKTVVTNNQAFLPILDFILQGSPGGGIDEPTPEPGPTMKPTPSPIAEGICASCPRSAARCSSCARQASSSRRSAAVAPRKSSNLHTGVASVTAGTPACDTAPVSAGDCAIVSITFELHPLREGRQTPLERLLRLPRPPLLHG